MNFHRLTRDLPKTALGGRAALVWVLLLAFSGCAGLQCQPTSITVAEKQERARLETAPQGYRSETGRLEELRRPEIVRDYWVRDDEGRWHRVSPERYREAAVGRPMRICE